MSFLDRAALSLLLLATARPLACQQLDTVTATDTLKAEACQTVVIRDSLIAGRDTVEELRLCAHPRYWLHRFNNPHEPPAPVKREDRPT